MNPIWRAFETQPDRAALAHPGDGTSTLPALYGFSHLREDDSNPYKAGFFGASI